MIGYKFAYKHQYKDIIFSTSENFDEVCHVEGKSKIYEFITGRNILDDFILWCVDLMICTNKTMYIRPESNMRMYGLYLKLCNTRDELQTIAIKTQTLIDKFKILRNNVIDELYHAELLENYVGKIKAETIKARYDTDSPNLFYGSFLHKLIDKVNNNGYTQRMNNYIDTINNYNHMDELIDWIHLLIYTLYKSGYKTSNDNKLITELTTLSCDAMDINNSTLEKINNIKALQDEYLVDFINYYGDEKENI